LPSLYPILTLQAFGVSNTATPTEGGNAMGFTMQIRPDVLKKLREDYPEGCTVELVEMCDPYRTMPVGIHGIDVIRWID